MSLPYETATAGDKALMELQRMLSKFGCDAFGTMVDTARGITLVHFRWKGRTVNLEASWNGYAAAWIKANPYTYRTKMTRDQHKARAIEQARVSVCSVLRDWGKSQITAVECGIMSFETAFMPHMLTNNGQRVIDRVQQEILPALESVP